MEFNFYVGLQQEKEIHRKDNERSFRLRTVPAMLSRESFECNLLLFRTAQF